MADETKANGDELETGSVTDRVLTAFTAAVAAEPDQAELAARLHKTLIEERDFSEKALRTALFDSAAS